MAGYTHRPDCDCDECWTLVYVSPPIVRQRFVAYDPAWGTGDFSAGFIRHPGGQLEMISVAPVQRPNIERGSDPALSVAFRPEYLPPIPGHSTHSKCVGCGKVTPLGVHDCGECPI